MDVIDLSERRQQAAESGPDVAQCACGEAWWELRGGITVAPHGAVCMDREGRVTGYAGVPHCVSCGQPWLIGLRPR